MTCKSLLAVVGLAALAGSIALAQPAKDAKPGATPAKEAKPTGQPTHVQPGNKDAKSPGAQPDGMPALTEQQQKDMAICMEAGKPGKEHAELAKAVGSWNGKTKMWMGPDSKAPEMSSECKQTITSVMDGRFIRIEVQGDMAGMPFNGFGLAGFDNVSKKYVSTWVDNCGSGIMNGTGEASSDGKVITFTYNYNCPIAKKPTTMREVHTHKSANNYTLEMFGKDPHSGKEFKMMEIDFTRAGPTADATR